MREIKFRAWHIPSTLPGEEAKGYMLYGNDDEWAEWFEVKDNPIGIVNRIFNGTNTDGKWIFMQFTGLKDKNGREIYEGDIVKVKYYSGEEIVGFIEWIDKYSIFTINITKKKDTYRSLYEGIDIEVIGNIYENPELLEGDKK